MPDFAVVTAFKATDKMSPAFNKMGAAADRFGARAAASMGVAGRAMSSMRGLLPVIGIGYAMHELHEAAGGMARLETSFRSVFKADATRQMEFVAQEANRLGLNLERSAGAYKGIAAAAKGTAINNAIVKQTFLGVSEAATALQLTGEQTEGALLAISQIISKGKVSMEELRGQLGERIPGAMQIAARAMNTTTAGLEDMVKAGIPAERFIPAFAAQMRREFGPAAAEAATDWLATEERFKSAMFTFKATAGTALIPALTETFTAATPLIVSLGEWIKENREVVSTLAKMVPPLIALGGTIWAVKKVSAAYQGVLVAVRAAHKIGELVDFLKTMGAMKKAMEAAQVATYGQAAAQDALNASMASGVGTAGKLKGILAAAGVVAVPAAIAAAGVIGAYELQEYATGDEAGKTEGGRTIQNILSIMGGGKALVAPNAAVESRNQGSPTIIIQQNLSGVEQKGETKAKSSRGGAPDIEVEQCGPNTFGSFGMGAG